MISQKDIDYMNECTTRDVIQLLVQEKKHEHQRGHEVFLQLKDFQGFAESRNQVVHPKPGLYL